MRLKFCTILFLGILITLTGCGKDSPFSEDYWDNTDQAEPAAGGGQSEQERATFSADLTPLTPQFANTSGTVQIDTNGDTVTTTLSLVEVPQGLSITTPGFGTSPCQSIVINTTDFPDPNLGTKTYSSTETGTREGLIASLGGNQVLEGRTFVVNAALVNTVGTRVVPVACGVLTQAQVENNTDGGTIGGTNIGVAGGVTVGTVAGATTGVNTGVNAGATTGFTTGTTVGVTTGINAGSTTGFNTGTTAGINTGVNAGVTTGLTTSGVTTGINSGVTTGLTTRGVTTGFATTGVTSGVTSGVTTGTTSAGTTGF